MLLPPSVTSEADKGLLSNKLWRVQNLYKIRDKKRRLTKMTLNSVQWEIWKLIKDQTPVRYFNVKYRQGGVSTFFLLWWLDDTIFMSNTATGILAHKRESLGYLMRTVRTAHGSMHNSLQPRLGDDSKTSLSFPDVGSQIMVSLSIRSTAVNNLHVSEWCLAKDEEVQASIGAATPDANISGESTGNGVGNYGYEVYQEAKAGENGYTAHFVPWFIQEEYQRPLLEIEPRQIMDALKPEERKLQALMLKDYGLILTPQQVLWRRWAVSTYKHLRGQEFPETDEEAFRTSGSKFFDYKKIHRLMMNAKERLRARPPVAVGPNDDWVQFETVQKGHIYAAGGDPAEGGADNSGLKIINVTERREAFVYRARCGVDTFAGVCDHWGRYFNNALLGIERNNHGHAVLALLNQESRVGQDGRATNRYPNLYKEMVVPAGGGIVGQKFPKEKLGWLTNKESRPLILDGLKFALEGDSEDDEDNFVAEIEFLDTWLMKEALTFEEIDGKFQAVSGEKDDDLLASAIAFQMYARLKRLTIKSEGLADRFQVGGQREAS